MVQGNNLDIMDQPDEEDIANNPYIMSTTQPMGHYSFVDSRQGYYKLAPPPKYFSDEFLQNMFA